MNRIKLLVLIGPTSSGKSELAIKLAKRFDGEIISADSRQIYKGMNLGTGKISGKWISPQFDGRQIVGIYLFKGIRHHLLDFVNPKRQYSAALFQRRAQKTIAEIVRRGKLPIITGGTGHWIDSVVYDLPIPDVKPNPKLRARLGKKSAGDLYHQLKKLDPRRAKNIDAKNKHRLIRALEIILTTEQAIPPLLARRGRGEVAYNAIWLGLRIPQADLYKKIDLRLKQRLKAGMVNEVKRLHKHGLSWKRLESFGLEYRHIAQFLQRHPNHSLPADGERVREGWKEMVRNLSYAIKHYSKRQLTWWKRNKNIIWINQDEKKVMLLVSKFLHH